MAKIMVDPAKLKSAAGKMEQQAVDYQRVYEELYSAVSEMANAWQGTDNVAYTTQIQGFKDDLVKMKKLMDDYSAFLKQSADVYKSTQDQIAAQAKTLTN